MIARKLLSAKCLVVLLAASNGDAAPAPASVVCYPSDSKVLVQWANYAGATDYRMVYKRTTDPAWISVPDTIGTTPGVTVTGLANGTSYDFRVTAMVNGFATDTTATSSATPTTVYDNSISSMILSTGQSLSIGYAGAPSLSITQPFNNKMLNAYYSELIPLVEPATGAASGVESMSSAMANMLSNLSRADAKVQSIVTCHGWGGTPYSGIKKGTDAYTQGMWQLSAARTLTNAALRPFRVSAITTIHGESDELAGVTASVYEGYLKEWQHDYETDAKVRTGQDGTVPLFLCQASSWVATSHTTPTTAIGQLNAAIDNPDKIYLVTPKYMLEYIDGIHLTNYSYRRLGEYYGKVMKKVLVDKEPWMPLYPTSIVLTGNVITVQFHVPSPPLQFDTNAVLFKTNYGFEYQDNTMSANISKVAITGPQTVTITLDKTPTASAKKLAYAYTGILGWAGRNISTAPRGNLRDSDTTTAFYQDANVPASMGNALKNWSVTFCEPITMSGLWVSDMPVTIAANGWGTAQMDRSIIGKPLTLRGTSYTKGLGVHAVSTILVPLDKKYARFSAFVGVDDEVNGNGSVVFQVWGDGQKLFESPLLHGGEVPVPVDVSVANVTQLALNVLDGQDGDGNDHGDWASARVANTIQSAFERIEAESYDSRSGMCVNTCAEGGQDLGCIGTGDYALYKNIDFGSGAKSFSARISAPFGTGKISVLLDDLKATPVGVLTNTATTGGWEAFTTGTTDISMISGVHDVYLQFETGINLNWFTFGRDATAIRDFPKARQNSASWREEHLNLSLAWSGATQVRMITMSGKPVLAKTISGPSANIHVGNLPPGIYLLEARSDAGMFRQKLIKN